MIVPSTIVCGTSGCMPNAWSAQPLVFRLSCTAFTHEEPISSPMHCFAMEPLRRKILSRRAEISKNCRRLIVPSSSSLPHTYDFHKSGNAVLLHLVEEGAVADLQQPGRVGPIPLGHAERSSDQVLL